MRRDEFDPRMDDYLVWRISLPGSRLWCDPFAQLNAPLKAVWLGRHRISDAHMWTITS
jgi:hypothetical protein